MLISVPGIKLIYVKNLLRNDLTKFPKSLPRCMTYQAQLFLSWQENTRSVSVSCEKGAEVMRKLILISFNLLYGIKGQEWR